MGSLIAGLHNHRHAHRRHARHRGNWCDGSWRGSACCRTARDWLVIDLAAAIDAAEGVAAILVSPILLAAISVVAILHAAIRVGAFGGARLAAGALQAAGARLGLELEAKR